MQRMMIAAVLAATSATFAGTLDCTPQQTAKLTADDGASDDIFGYSVATSDGIAVIGAWKDDDNGSSSGSAYVYEQQADGTWQQTTKLTADDGASGDSFGESVATSDGIAVIGADGDDDNGTNSGSAYVYEQQGDGTWQQIAKLTADDGVSGDFFGYSVATSGGVAVIGAYGDDDNGSYSGSAYVYEQQANGTWQQVAKLTADDGASSDYFGYSVATSGGVAVIGANGDDDNGSGSGSAYVYEQQGDGTWQQVAKLTADDGASNDYFGYSVATSGGVAVIGAYYDDDNGSASGSAYVYEQQADGTWQQTAKLTADDGAYGEYFGISVATSGGVAVIGAYYDDDNGSGSGSAYVYEQQPDSTWQQIAKLTADDGASSDWFGVSVATSGGVAVIGANGDDDNGSASGSAYVFELIGADCNNNGICDTYDLLDGTSADCNGNGIPDECDTADGTSYDCDGDLVPDECEIDCDGDGLIDDCDSEPDQDDNGVPDNCDPDCNENGIADGVEILNGWADDCDDDLVPDECQLADGSATDCDGDGTLDHCQITDDPALDCDDDGVIDSCAIADGSVDDCDENGVPDSCDITNPDLDCDENGVIDSCAIADGSVEDCNQNGIPDSCDITTDPDLDCDENGVLDSCEVEPVLTQTAKLTADDGSGSDYFGWSVATSGGVAVIGAYRDDDNGSASGSAYVYEQQPDSTWQQIAKLTADDGASSDHFGISVATSGGVAVIGARYGDDDNGDYSGSAYVFEQQADGTWEQTAKLTADDGASDDNFGYSVATSGGVAVIGAYRDDDNGNSSGSAYVFEQQAGGTWEQTAKLTADDGASSDYFGYSVATSGGVAVIGANGDDDNGSGSGSAYVYEQQGDGTWQQVAKLTADDGASNDYFGYSVATSGGVAVIGASFDDDNGDYSGSAYVYEQQADGTWEQTAKLTADDGASSDYFGWSVATSGGVAVIGAYRDNDNGSDSGSAYVYEQQSDGTWQQIAKLTADDGGTDDRFGWSVATSDGVAVIGASYDDDNGSNSGSVYVFETFSQGDCDANGLMDDCEIQEEPSLDCDLDGVLDICAITDGSVDDCNENGIPDSCDFADGGDADGDGYLDKCECDADIAGPDGPLSDGVIDIYDLLAVIGYWGSSIPGGDVDGDGIVGINDLLAVIGAWGPCE